MGIVTKRKKGYAPQYSERDGILRIEIEKRIWRAHTPTHTRTHTHTHTSYIHKQTPTHTHNILDAEIYRYQCADTGTDADRVR